MYLQPRLLIGGQWLEAAGPAVPVIDPATEETISHYNQADAGNVVNALEASQAGLVGWSGLSPWRHVTTQASPPAPSTCSWERRRSLSRR